MPEIVWPKTPAEALAQQRELVRLLPPERPLAAWRLVGGLDVSYSRRLGMVYAALVVLEAESHRVVETVYGEAPADFPYIPGLLSYREGPAGLDAWRRLHYRPDVLLCDGQGKAHPRRLGLASHLGLLIGLPTVGVAKSLLCGVHSPLGPEKGSTVPLVDPDGGEELGFVLRSRIGVKPLYISVGAGIDPASARLVVESQLTRYRLPEPARLAHQSVTRRRLRAEEA